MGIYISRLLFYPDSQPNILQRLACHYGLVPFAARVLKSSFAVSNLSTDGLSALFSSLVSFSLSPLLNSPAPGTMREFR